MTPAPPLLQIEKLGATLRQADGSRRAILSDLNLTLARGERLGIVGESGSGKSLLASILIGLAPDTARASGSVRFDGQELLDLGEHELDAIRGRRIAMIFQEPATALNPAMRVGDQIAEAIRLDGRGRAQARREAASLMERVRIRGAADRFGAYPHELSGGQRQRIGIAIALARNPALLIADEPTTALDRTVQTEILDLLAELGRERGMALVLVSHDLDVVERVSERVLVLYAGAAMELGTAAGVLARPAHPYTKALLAAVPRRLPTGRLPTLPGTVPRFEALPPGCRFAPRCPSRLPVCDRGEPEWRRLADGRGVRCVRADEEGAP